MLKWHVIYQPSTWSLGKTARLSSSGNILAMSMGKMVRLRGCFATLGKMTCSCGKKAQVGFFFPKKKTGEKQLQLLIVQIILQGKF